MSTERPPAKLYESTANKVILKGMNSFKNRAFTVVELLVVIVVIGILATITVVSYRAVQEKARANDLSAGIATIKNGFERMAANQNLETWPINSDLGAVPINLNQLLKANTSSPSPTEMTLALQRYVSSGVPKVSGLEGSIWTYNNANNIRLTTTCDTNQTGVVLAISGVPAGIAKALDSSVDDGNLNCGVVRSNGSVLIYQLGFTQVMK